MTKLRTAVVGAGKMGSIHAKVYSSLPDSELVAIVDSDEKRAKKIAKKFKCQAITDCENLIGKVDAVTIATPTVTHMQLAEIFIKNKIAVLIEKPLAETVEQCQKIVALAKEYDTVVAVGHSERCNPVIQAVKRLQIKPLFIEAVRISPYPFRSTDVGVVLDVMIHDIDIILSLAASKVKEVQAIGVGVIDNDEDICNARITFENGCVANVTASRIAMKTERKVRLFSKKAYLSLDYFKKAGTIVKANTDNVDVVKKIRQLKNAGKFDLLTTNWSELFHIEKLQIDDKEPLKVEQEAFLKAVADRNYQPEVGAEEGAAAIECAHKILESLQKHQLD